ncbi:MAG: hypothetical protein HUK26_09380, partial [Duodenibacillus sp.]|nr:hypothetical protein [Duodenibacillus sp.]
MSERRENLLDAMTPRMKAVAAASAAAAALVAALWAAGGEERPRERGPARQSVQPSVLTDRNNRAVGMDALAGQVARLARMVEEQARAVIDLQQRVSDQAASAAAERERLHGRLAALRPEAAPPAPPVPASRLEAAPRQDRSRFASERLVAGAPAAGPGAPAVQGRAPSPAPAPSYPWAPVVPAPPPPAAAASGAPTASPAAEPSTAPSAAPSWDALRPRVHPLQRFTGKPAVPKAEPAKAEAEPVIEIPAGSILTGVLLTGADFPTGKGSVENPTPALIRLKKEAILPGRHRADVRECFLLAGGHGELASERARLRAETLSCVRRDGAVAEVRLSAYVAGEDGKAGLKGRLVSKQGQMIARTLAAGFLAGMSRAFDYDPVPVISTASDGRAQYQRRFSSDAAKGGLARGAATALEKVADFYMNLADQMVPVVEINAGRQVDVVVVAGARLEKGFAKAGGRAGGARQ